MKYKVKDIDYNKRIVTLEHEEDNHTVESNIKVNPMNWAPGLWAGTEGGEFTKHDLDYMLGYDIFGGYKGD